MDIVHGIYDTLKRAQYELKDFVYENKEEITKINYRYMYVTTNDNNDHYFLTEALYERWCLGREYILDDKLYRSSYPLKK